MPLKSGKDKKTLSSNIKTEMHSYKKTGKLGTSHPANAKKAQKQAVAIAFSKAREKKGSDNRYLSKIAEMVDNKIQQDTKKNIKSAPKANEKFFTRQKMRGV